MFDFQRVSSHSSIPIIASGGAGTMEHFHEVFTAGKAMRVWQQVFFTLKKLKFWP
jgi:cyclase